MNSDILIYQNQDGNIKIDVRLEEETVWLTQAQIGALFGKDKRTISEHIGNIFSERELEENSTVRKFRTVQLEGSREVEREIDHYNLDVIISVGYRVKSPQGTQFRIWATQRLKEYIIKGFALNDDRFKSPAIFYQKPQKIPSTGYCKKKDLGRYWEAYSKRCTGSHLWLTGVLNFSYYTSCKSFKENHERRT